ncbi:MAG: ribonuclease HI family protein [Candidatus Omnitrophica bacterium]|nr:ribonuclease HI family protein [Candidatus Omnitrophota bacterium]
MIEKGIIYSDGGARGNPGPAAVGAIVCDEKGNILQEHGEVIGETTNNVAEYTAVIVGLEMAKKLGIQEIQYFGDSQLVMFQLAGKYKVKTPHILTLFKQVKQIQQAFRKVTYNHVYRTHEKIRYVDGLVNEALDREGY